MDWNWGLIWGIKGRIERFEVGGKYIGRLVVLINSDILEVLENELLIR